MRAAMRAAMLAGALATGGPAVAQGLPGLPGGLGGGQGGGQPGLGNIPGLGGQPQTPQERREFCQRVAGAAARCGLTLDMTALTACLVRSLPPQDSMRVAQVANSARGDAGSLLSECGITGR